MGVQEKLPILGSFLSSVVLVAVRFRFFRGPVLTGHQAVLRPIGEASDNDFGDHFFPFLPSRIRFLSSATLKSGGVGLNTLDSF